jgi:hypothetical protein
MAKLELPSGGWVEYREELKAGDRFAAQAAAESIIGEDNRPRLNALGMNNSMRNALLAAIITGWSYPVPVPAGNDFVPDKEAYIGNTMPLRDYNVLAEAVEPLMKEIGGAVVENPKKPSKS